MQSMGHSLIHKKLQREDMEAKSRLRIPLAMVITALIFTSACASTTPEEYEFSYEECKNMRADKNHRFWKQPIAVQGCELIIFEFEVENSRGDQ